MAWSRLVVLTGMRGVGKSALAEWFASASSMRARVIAADTRAGLLADIHQLNPPPEPPVAPVAGSYATRPAPRPSRRFPTTRNCS